MKAIQERYKHDKERLNKEIMKFYKDTNFPAKMGKGCLPLILQMPILLSLFYLLFIPELTGNALEGEGFLWINDLTGNHDIIMAVLFATTTVASMLMTASDPNQRKLLIFMGGMLGIFSYLWPVGVGLYWTTQSLLTMGQTWFQFKLMGPLPSELKAKGKTGSLPKGTNGTKVEAQSDSEAADDNSAVEIEVADKTEAAAKSAKPGARKGAKGSGSKKKRK